MIKIIDNFITQEQQDKIYDCCVSPTFSWKMSPSVSRYNKFYTCNEQQVEFAKSRTDKLYESFQIGHQLIYDDSVVSPNLKTFTPIFDNLCNYFKSTITLNRVKVNCIMKNDVQYRGYHNTPHIDIGESHIGPNKYSAVYYVNDSDGDTIMFDQKYGMNIDKFTVKDKISPEAGRISIFDSDIYHTSSAPVDNRIRMVINLNFTVAI